MMKTKISYSAVDAFKECPQKYWNQRTHKIRSDSSAFGFGAAFESGVDRIIDGGTLEEAVNTFEVQWHTRPANRWEGEKQIFDSEEIFFYQSDFDKYLVDSEEDRKQIDKWYSEIFKKQPKEDTVLLAETILERFGSGSLSKEETKFVHRVMWLCCKRRGPVMLAAFQKEILPQIEEVLGAQVPIDITNDDDDQVTGFIDFIAKLKGIKGPIIMDLKSAGKLYEEHDLDTSDQLGIYALAEGIRNIGYWVVLKKMSYEVTCDKCGHLRENYRKQNCEKCEKGKYSKRKPYTATQVLTKQISDEFLESIQRDYSEVLMAIKNKVAWKNKKSCFNYGTKCEFYDHCWKNIPLDKLATVKKRESN